MLSDSSIVGIAIGSLIVVLLIGWLHFYLLPQYLVDFLQSFYDREEVIFSSKLYGKHEGLPVVALTIDDSPTDSTPAILDCLRHHNAKATFFIISSYIKGREHIMDRIIAEGHEVANHTTVDAASWKMSKEEFEYSLMSCEESIKPWFEKRQKSNDKENRKTYKWFRPGHGILSSSMLATLRRQRYRTAIVNVFPNDAQRFPKSCQFHYPQLNSWYLSVRTRAGAIVVLHDRQWTVSTLQMCLSTLSKRFYLTTLSNFIEICEEGTCIKPNDVLVKLCSETST